MNRINKLYKVIRSPALLRALLQGSAAGVEHDNVLQMLDCRLVVDIGANRGQFALIAKKSFPSAKIVAFEPLKEPAAIFRRIFSSDPLVVLHETAIGPEEKKMTMHVSRADDSSSLLPISALQSRLFPGTAEKEIRTVQVKSLDAILSTKDIQKPALLKIDVQGFEKEVLDGCTSLLPSFSYVYVECSFVELYVGQSLAHEVISFLDKFGFILSGIYNLTYDKNGIAVQADFLFKNKNMPT